MKSALTRLLLGLRRRILDEPSTLVLLALGAIAIRRLGLGFYALTVGVAQFDSVDLHLRYRETQLWFSGSPVYVVTDPQVLPSANYPPGTYSLLWIQFLNLPFDSLRWLWAVWTAAALGWVLLWGLEVSQVRSRRQQLLLALVVLAPNCVATTIAFGQLGLQSLALGIGALHVIARRPPSLRLDVLAGLLFTLSLTKPTVTAPFGWLLVFVFPRCLALASAFLGYVLATGLAVALNGRPFSVLFSEWARLSLQWTLSGAGHTNLPVWLNALGMSSMFSILSLVMMLCFGLWVHGHRKADPWLLVGAASLFARLWTYHRGYDDILILPALMALLRSRAWLTEGSLRALADALFLATAASLLLPSRLRVLHEALSPSLWACSLIFLAAVVRQRGSPSAP